jgi:hypothetical protein
MHDTVTFGTVDEKPYDNGMVSKYLKGVQSVRTGLKMALQDFLEANPEWKLSAHYGNNNGLTVLIKP